MSFIVSTGTSILGRALVVYVVAVNACTLLYWRWDKRQSISKKRRISERTLLTLVACGGGLGALLGMGWFRHKISKGSFLLRYRGIMFVYLVLVILFIIYLPGLYVF